MKKWITAFAILLLAISANAQDKEGLLAPSYFKGSITEANELASSEERSFLVMVYDNEDHELLKFFREEVLSDSSVIEVLDERFVCMYENSTSKNGKILIKQFEIDKFPAIQFVSLAGELLFSVKGKMDPDQMIDTMRRRVFND